MAYGHRTSIWSRALIAGALFLAPTAAFANFFWPPALYYYGATVWWAVPAGLVAEWILLFPFVRRPPMELVKIVLIANAASALVGFLVTWPLVFWERGIEALVKGGFLSVLLIAALIFVLNVAIEYAVSVKWLGVPRKGVALIGYVLANAASFAILVAAGLSALRI